MIRSFRAITWKTLLLVLAPISMILGAEALPVAVPPADAAAWLSDPQGALQANLAAAQALLQFYTNMSQGLSIAGWALGALGVIVAIGKFIPQVQPFTDMLWGIVSHKNAQKADKEKEIMAQGFLDVAAIMRSFPRDSKLGEVIDKMQSRLPPEVTAAYRAWEKEQVTTRPPTEAEKLPPIDIGAIVAAVTAAIGRPTNPG